MGSLPGRSVQFSPRPEEWEEDPAGLDFDAEYVEEDESPVGEFFPGQAMPAFSQEALLDEGEIDSEVSEHLDNLWQQMLQRQQQRERDEHVPHRKMILGRMYIEQMLCYLARSHGRSGKKSRLGGHTLFQIARTLERYLLAYKVCNDVTLCIINYLFENPPPGDGKARTEYIKKLAQRYHLSNREVEPFVISYILDLDYVMLPPVVQLAAELINRKVDSAAITQAIRRLQGATPRIERIPLKNSMTPEEFEEFINDIPSPALCCLGWHWKENGMPTCANTPDGEYTLTPNQLPFLPPIQMQS